MGKSLVDTNWIAEHINDPRVRLIEIDWDGLTAYESGHIPGALGWYWKSALWDPFERQFPTSEDFAQRLGDAGIGNDTTVVFYGAPVQFGTYAWWVFKYMGHDDVRILDGGGVKWRQEGRPITTSVPDVEKVDYRPGKRNERIRAGRQDVLRELGANGCRLLDHRSVEEYAGERVGLPGKPDVGAERYGRIPGAASLPFDMLLNENTSFKTPDQLQKILSAQTSTVDQPVISYCRLSHRATLASFAMTEILDYTNVRVYDGSWTEWGSLVGVPIER